MYNLLLHERLTHSDPPACVGNLTTVAKGWQRSIRANGGYWLGSFTLDIERLSQENLIWFYNNCIGNHVEETTVGITSWEGLVYEMTLTLDGVQYRRTLDKEFFHNRVNVWYRDADVQTATGWSEDTDSSDEYGQMDYIDTIGEATTAAATALRDMRLEDFAFPRSRMVGGLKFGNESMTTAIDNLRITVAGYVFTLNWRYRETSIVATAADTAITDLVDDSEFVAAGIIDTNSLNVDLDCSIPQRLWDGIEDIILQGDASGNRWVGGVYKDKVFDYKAAATTVSYYIRGGQLFNSQGQIVVPSLLEPDFIVQNANAPGGEIPVGGNLWDQPENAWITEVEFVAPDGLILKPSGFEDVDVLKERLRL